MTFKILQPAESDERTEPLIAVAPSPRPSSRQLTLRLNGRPVGVAPVKPPGRSSSQVVQAHITHLAGQIDALREQLREHSADRIALLLNEMIEERERELERWVAREEAWDQRLGVIEGAISERDEFRRREADLVRERDEARRAAAAAAAQRDTAQRAAEAARREAESVRRVANQATAEQLRLRAERELDERVRATQRRELGHGAAPSNDRGWLSRLIRR